MPSPLSLSIVKNGPRSIRNRAASIALAALACSIAVAPNALAQGAKGQAKKAQVQQKAGAPKDDAAAKGREPTAEDRALRGVVVIERNGTPLSLGAVLASDGRILTALSPIGPGNDLDARYADGSTVKVKLGHHDRMWDLALLVPQSGKWNEGLIASSKEPIRQDATIHAFTINKGKAQVANMILRSHKMILGGDDKQLDDAIEIGSRVTPTDLGTPIIDEDGRVVGILGRGCAPNDKGPCTPVAFGATISAIKQFLRTVPSTAVAPAAWLGIQGIAENSGVAKGVRVLSVHPESPADEAKLHGGEGADGDVIVAVDGQPVTTPEALAEAIHAHGIGEKVPLMVMSGGKYKTVTVLLRAAPEPGKAKDAPPPANPAELPPLDAPTVSGNGRRPPPPPPRRKP